MDSILRQGSKGNAVSELQQLLQNKGFYTGKIDGDFGQGTLNAVLKFQKDNGLQADGIVGNSSWAALRAASKPATNPTSVNILPTLLLAPKAGRLIRLNNCSRQRAIIRVALMVILGQEQGMRSPLFKELMA